MSIWHWIDIAIALASLVLIGVAFSEYRHGKRNLSSTIGWILFLLLQALGRGLPVVAPRLTAAADVLVDLAYIGLLIVIVSWFIEQRKKA